MGLVKVRVSPGMEVDRKLVDGSGGDPSQVADGGDGFSGVGIGRVFTHSGQANDRNFRFSFGLDDNIFFNGIRQRCVGRCNKAIILVDQLDGHFNAVGLVGSYINGQVVVFIFAAARVILKHDVCSLGQSDGLAILHNGNLTILNFGRVEFHTPPLFSQNTFHFLKEVYRGEKRRICDPRVRSL